MKRISRSIFGATLAIAVSVAPLSAANAAPVEADSTAQVVEQVEAPESVPTFSGIAQLLSDTVEPLFVPETIQVVSVETGEVVETIDEKSKISSRITQLGPGCSTDSLCLYPPTAIGIGFVGAGTKSGAWAKRNKYDSKRYSNQAWWQHDGKTVTGGKKAPGNLVLLTGTTTITKVQIF